MATTEYPIFVYGTLRPNTTHYRQVQPFIREDRNEPADLTGFQLYSFGPFPSVCADPGAELPVRGDLLYFLPGMRDAALERLDIFEGVDWLFNRRIEEVRRIKDGKLLRAYIYLTSNQTRRDLGGVIVPDNDWQRWIEKVNR